MYVLSGWDAVLQPGTNSRINREYMTKRVFEMVHTQGWAKANANLAGIGNMFFQSYT